MVSNCCSALPIGETHDNLGFCSECREHAEFKEMPEDDYFKDIQPVSYTHLTPADE